ncbi:MAG: gamma carbonic anhydrase family protein [Blastocatellia bacterium]|nr:gamma carbonic anhydrase family protein [Blastocatellia bacterium]MCS7158310.1 gamma carbonic anhydrase family protein [Blastocatellia bacterium]MCX7753148.1 gamma carbonic anhydrase family protein [Blastocatellia bacterium]MDW8169463.1 gamma carbonic anhydrase family protein [Acidobacteriota bacterium]MDW8255737.1 gamma carbonic anhydrase family protein [Acidobacteriota bacterium]
MILPFRGVWPQIAETAFVEETAIVVGDVEIGEHSSIWFHAVVRGDVHRIRIGRDTNIQDGVVVHVTGGRFPVLIGDRVTIGHRAIVHGCTIGDECLIGMGAILLDGVVVGERSLIAAGSVVREGTQVPPGSLVAGVPARIVRELTEEELRRIEGGWRSYRELKEQYLAGRVRGTG